MARSKPWFKHWASGLDDGDLLNLSLAEEGAWWRLYKLAHMCNHDGCLVDPTNGSPLSRQSILDACHISSIQATRSFYSMLKKRTDQGALRWEGEMLVLTTYHDEQSTTASDTKDAINERVKRYRDRHRQLASNVTESPLHNNEPDSNVTDSALHGPLSSSSGVANSSIRDIEIKSVTAKNSLHNRQERGVNEPDGNGIGVTVSREFRANHATIARVASTETDLALHAQNVWEKALEYLRLEVNKANFTTFFEKSVASNIDGSVMTVCVSSPFSQEYLVRNQRSLVERAISQVSGQALQVRFVVGGQQ